jgi:PDZ domain-containing protein
MAGCARQTRHTDVDTIDQMVVPPPPGWDTSEEASSWRWLRWAAPAFVIVLLLLGSMQVSLPYYALAPGDARQVNDLIRVPKDRSFPPRGEVLLSTVSLSRVNALEAFIGWLDGDVDVLPEDQILGTTPRDRFTEQNIQEMDTSKQVAAVVALRRLGYAVDEQGKGALVVHVEDKAPASGRLVQGDVITGIDGRAASLSQEVVQAIRQHKPGESVRLDVLGVKGETRVEEVVLGSRPQRSEGYLGVVLNTKEQKFDYPFDVVIDSGTIGGPSAGLAFTLGVLDTLTAGELTGGKKVAATGTIEIDGHVGDVGGVVQKTAAVRAAGASVFLVPPGEYDDARRHAGPKLDVVQVASLDDAIAALARLGGDVSALGVTPAGTPG